MDNSIVKKRIPVLAVILSLLATGLGQIYSGKLVKGLALFFISFAFAPVIVLLADSYSSTFTLAVIIASQLLIVFVFIYAAFDSWKLARSMKEGYTLKEFNRWYIYAIFIIVSLIYPSNMTRSIRDNIIQAYKIPSSSMSPSILRGDYILINKTIYRHSPVKRGDVAVFINPNARHMDFIKRVVAMPGDTVEIKQNRLVINGRELGYAKVNGAGVMEEDNNGVKYKISLSGDTLSDFPAAAVPNGMCFMMGDNRNQSHDSRIFGPVPLADIKGRVEYIYFSTVSMKRFGRFKG